MRNRKFLAAVITAAVMGTAMCNSVQALAAEFDPIFYAKTYPDIAEALGTDAEVLYNHYVTYGQKEGRIPRVGAAAGEDVEGIAGTTVAPSADITAPPLFAPVTSSWTEARQLWYQGLPHGYQPDYSQYTYTAEQYALLAQKQAEFDAGGYVRVGWTEEQVYDRLMWIKENLYPEGTKVGLCELGVGYICTSLYGPMSTMNCGWDSGWEQELFPAGMVTPMRSYPKSPFKDEVTTMVGHMKDRIRTGDIIYTTNAKGTGHVSVVLTHDENGVTVVESNINGDEKMHWGGFISWDELYNGNSYDHTGGCASVEHYLY